MDKDKQQEFIELRKLYVDALSKVPYFATFLKDIKIGKKLFAKGESYKILKEDEKYYYIQHTSSSIEVIPFSKKLEEEVYVL